MARPGVDGQVGTGLKASISEGRKPYNRAMTIGSALAPFSGPKAERQSVPRRVPRR